MKLRKRQRRVRVRRKTKQEKKQKNSENKERGVLEKDLSYPHAPSKKHKKMKFFDNLLSNISFAEAPEQK